MDETLDSRTNSYDAAECGPPADGAGDWYPLRRPGRRLDAAVRLADPERQPPAPSLPIRFIRRLIGGPPEAIN